ncbi:DUF6545 domain-containing protein [Streptomyces sp. NPDC056500]|uniref:DUF6545 domain-containing protein n=1 Tax=Streptomyces sp. NPDC056500 TaxID=3345840 RepID=UPI00369CBE9A
MLPLLGPNNGAATPAWPGGGDIALNPLMGWWNMRLRVYRRVIAIRDGLLDLQAGSSEATTCGEGTLDSASLRPLVLEPRTSMGRPEVAW